MSPVVSLKTTLAILEDARNALTPLFPERPPHYGDAITDAARARTSGWEAADAAENAVWHALADEIDPDYEWPRTGLTAYEFAEAHMDYLTVNRGLVRLFEQTADSVRELLAQ